MISLSTITASTDTIILHEQGEHSPIDSEARASKVKCLDGSTAHTHLGVSVGDEELIFKAVVSSEEIAILERLHRNYAEITIATSTGVYSGYIFSLRWNGYLANVTLRKKARLDV